MLDKLTFHYSDNFALFYNHTVSIIFVVFMNSMGSTGFFRYEFRYEFY